MLNEVPYVSCIYERAHVVLRSCFCKSRHSQCYQFLTFLSVTDSCHFTHLKLYKYFNV